MVSRFFNRTSGSTRFVSIVGAGLLLAYCANVFATNNNDQASRGIAPSTSNITYGFYLSNPNNGDISKYRLTLASGWNMITSPYNSQTISANSITSAVSGTKLYGFNALEGYTLFPINIEPCKGYWVYSPQVTTIDYVFDLNANPIDKICESFAVQDRWNLLGVSSAAISGGRSKDSIKKTYGATLVWWYDPSIGNYSANENINDGGGMWIFPSSNIIGIGRILNNFGFSSGVSEEFYFTDYSKLPKSIELTLADADPCVLKQSDSSKATFKCTPTGYGNKKYTLKDTNSGTILETGTVEVDKFYGGLIKTEHIFGQSLLGFKTEPSTIAVGQPVTFTATFNTAATSGQFQFEGLSKHDMICNGKVCTYYKAEGLADTNKKTFNIYPNSSSAYYVGSVQAVSSSSSTTTTSTTPSADTNATSSSTTTTTSPSTTTTSDTTSSKK